MSKPKQEFVVMNIAISMVLFFVLIALVIVISPIIDVLALPYSLGYLIFILLPLLVFLRNPYSEIVSCNISNRTINSQNGTVTVNQRDSVVLSRHTKTIYPSIREEDGDIYYGTTWLVLLEQKGERIELAEFSLSRKNKNDIELFNQPAIDAFVEFIAEMYRITLIDETGIQAVIREPGKTDLSLTEYLTNNRSVVDMDLLNKTNNFSLIHKGDTFEFIQRDGYRRWGFLIIFGLALYSVWYFITNFNPIVLAIWTLIALVSWNYGLRQQKIIMKREKIVIQVKGFFFPISTHSIPLGNIERIIPTETVDGDVALEFMGDNIRVRIDGDYNAEEAIEFRKLTEAIIVSLNS